MTKKVSSSRSREVSKSAKRSKRVNRTSTRDINIDDQMSPTKGRRIDKNVDEGSIEEETLDRDAPYNKTYGLR